MSQKPIAFKIEKTPQKTVKKTAKKPGKRKPRAIPLDDIVLEPEIFESEKLKTPKTLPIPEPKTMTKTIKWGAIFFSAFTGLIMMWAALTFIELVENLFARSQILGWIATALLALAALAALALILRELFGIFSLRKISRLRDQATDARNTNDANSAAKIIDKLTSIYSGRSDLKWGLAALKEHQGDIIDGRDRINMAERELLVPLDKQAGQIIAAASRKVTLLTAITPAAILDILFVAAQNLKMLRQLAVLYGGRPGTLGTFKLAGMVLSHLAITGGLALTDSLIQQFIGKGLLGRLSARFGEGAVNGILTSRIGLAALDLTRPIPFSAELKPNLSDFLKNIVSIKSALSPENAEIVKSK